MRLLQALHLELPLRLGTPDEEGDADVIWHCCMDIEGFLTNTNFPRGFVGLLKHDDGRPMTPEEARTELFAQLRQGKRVIPMGPCDGFDFQTGCPGHEEAGAPPLKTPG